MPVCHSPSNDANASDTQRNRIRNRQLSARQWPARLSFLLLLLSEWIGVAWRGVACRLDSRLAIGEWRCQSRVFILNAHWNWSLCLSVCQSDGSVLCGSAAPRQRIDLCLVSSLSSPLVSVSFRLVASRRVTYEHLLVRVRVRCAALEASGTVGAAL